jgi:hypothetical protein
VIAGLDRQAFGGETGGTVAGRRTKRSYGRFCLNIAIENPDGTERRISFYGRTQAEAKANRLPPASASAALDQPEMRPGPR